jgi:hypothetical protein
MNWKFAPVQCKSAQRFVGQRIRYCGTADAAILWHASTFAVGGHTRLKLYGHIACKDARCSQQEFMCNDSDSEDLMHVNQVVPAHCSGHAGPPVLLWAESTGVTQFHS